MSHRTPPSRKNGTLRSLFLRISLFGVLAAGFGCAAPPRAMPMRDVEAGSVSNRVDRMSGSASRIFSGRGTYSRSLNLGAQRLGRNTRATGNLFTEDIPDSAVSGSKRFGSSVAMHWNGMWRRAVDDWDDLFDNIGHSLQAFR